MTSNLRACALCFAVVFVLFASASAQAQTITVVGVDPSGPNGALAASATAGALRGAASVPGYTVEDYTHVGVNDTMQLLGCSEVDDHCLQAFASTLGSRMVVIGQLRQDRGVVLDLSVYDAGVARTLTQTALELPSRGVADYVAYHLGAFLQGRVVVHVTSLPQEGQVFIDDVPLGATPATTDVFAPGRHAVRVEFPDGRVGNLDVELASLARFTLAVSPSGSPRALMAEAPSQAGEGVRPLRALGWSAVVMGVAGGAVAVVGGLQVREAQRDFDQTPFQRAAEEAAARGERSALMTNVAIGVGAAAMVGGVAALLIDRNNVRRERALRAAITPTAGGAHAFLRLDL